MPSRRDGVRGVDLRRVVKHTLPEARPGVVTKKAKWATINQRHVGYEAQVKEDTAARVHAHVTGHPQGQSSSPNTLGSSRKQTQIKHMK